MKERFWNWVTEDEERSLYLDGYIAENSWLGDDITPKQFKSELFAQQGNVSIYLNSPGGDVFAASQIYTLLKEYPGKVTIKIQGLAASAASMIAMAADEVQMSPVAMMMIHNPATMVFGEVADLQMGIDLLMEVKESIINAYEQKTGLSRTKIAHMMDRESWFNAKKAVELGFADQVMYEPNRITNQSPSAAFLFDQQTVKRVLINKLPHEPIKRHATTSYVETRTPIHHLDKRLQNLKR